MKSFLVKWTASGYAVTFRYQIIAHSMGEAKEQWAKFVAENEEVQYTWEKAEKAVRLHYGGYITWEEGPETEKEPGCYELEWEDWNTGSDHLRD